MNGTKLFVFAIACIALGWIGGQFTNSEGAHAQHSRIPSVKSLLKQDLPEFEGREVRLEEVTFPPGAMAPPHRHPGHVFVYVLEGQIESALEDDSATIYTKGDTFYEPSDGLHAVTKNPSDTDTARILAVMIAKEDKPSTVLEPRRD